MAAGFGGRIFLVVLAGIFPLHQSMLNMSANASAPSHGINPGPPPAYHAPPDEALEDPDADTTQRTGYMLIGHLRFLVMCVILQGVSTNGDEDPIYEQVVLVQEGLSDSPLDDTPDWYPRFDQPVPPNSCGRQGNRQGRAARGDKGNEGGLENESIHTRSTAASRCEQIWRA